MLSRREFLGVLSGLAVSDAWFRQDPIAFAAAKSWSLEDFAKNIQSGGPPKDGIPPIDKPKYVTPAKAEKFLKPEDIIFGLDYRGTVKAYPQKILVWHEIVNEEVSGEQISITYCPLTGSAVGFRGRSRMDGQWLTFGTSGMLVNSNLLMYDRQTDSRWPQILGAAISGPMKGTRLEEIPLAWTTWERWQRRHPNTQVLSTETGYFRTYGRDPYGSYQRSGNYYDSGGPFFPVMAQDNRFNPKKVVLGIKNGDARVAIPKSDLQSKKVVNAQLGSLPVAAFYDSSLDSMSAHVRRTKAGVLKFRVEEKGGLVDEATGSSWNADGRSTDGKLKGTQLEPVSSFDVMWFAWYAFFPETVVVG